LEIEVEVDEMILRSGPEAANTGAGIAAKHSDRIRLKIMILGNNLGAMEISP